jgi:hypothetical protein
VERTHIWFDSRLVSGTSGSDDFVIVVEYLEEGIDNVVVCASGVEVVGTVVVDLGLGVGQGAVGAPLGTIGT